MSNTDKYEVDAQPIADALLLLEEVKRLQKELDSLRKQFKLAYDWVDYQFTDGGISDFARYIGDEEE